MAEYQRFIAYLYEYGQDGIKHSAGHLRVELRQGNCRMTVKVRAKKMEGNCKLYFYIRKPGVFAGFPVGEAEIVHGETEFCFEANASNLDGQGNSFEPVCGILLFGNTTEYLAADWNNQDITPKEAEQVRPAGDESQGSAETEVLERKGAEEKKFSESETTAERLKDVTETKKPWEIENKSQQKIKSQTEVSGTGYIKTEKVFPDNQGSNTRSEPLVTDSPSSNRRTEVLSVSNLDSDLETNKLFMGNNAETEKLSAGGPDSNVRMEELPLDNNNSDRKNTQFKEQIVNNSTAISKEDSAAERGFCEKMEKLAAADPPLSENELEVLTEKIPPVTMTVSEENNFNTNSGQQLVHKNNEKQTAEREIFSDSREPAPDFWSAAKDIVKNLLNAEQEQDPLDQITAVLHSRRRRVQMGNNMMPSSAAPPSSANGKTSEESSTQSQEASNITSNLEQNKQSESNIKEAVKESAVLQGKKEGSTLAETGPRKDSSHGDAGSDHIQAARSETEILEDPEKKNVSVALEESANLPVGQSQKGLQEERQAVSSRQMAEKETAAADAGTAIKGTQMESLNAAARAYCGNRRLPWQDAPEARELLDTCVKMYPFQDGELAECVRVEPKDIGRLPMEYWNLGNNSFLLHGYCSYKYLLFAKRMNRIRCEYLLMVPGVYQQREKMMARMFGFEQFKCARRREQRPGEFGYWYITLIF